MVKLGNTSATYAAVLTSDWTLDHACCTEVLK